MFTKHFVFGGSNVAQVSWPAGPCIYLFFIADRNWMCVFSAQYKFLHTIYVLFDVTTFTTYSLFVYRLLKTEAVRLLAVDKMAKD